MGLSPLLYTLDRGERNQRDEEKEGKREGEGEEGRNERKWGWRVFFSCVCVFV